MAEPLTAPTVEFEVVRPEYQKHPGGRPLFLDAKRFIRVCRHIEEGHSAVVACRRESVTYRLFRMHVTRSATYRRRLKEAEEVREHFWREYHLANLLRHAADTPSVSMFFLERKYPGEFSLRQVVRDTGDAETQPLCERISLTQLTENARLMAETLANPPPGLMFHEEPASPPSEEAVS